ncbi:hypothetical protein GCM10011581_34660 [Saccharopolyspora subtropica]|uniref:Uncharacterized protein n=1 Tax=Saccharopolyspora thermophila TaxID=89367 RepID=A0A917K2N7_9PSEU|nr:hypothetical protein GCM10011581_34660 [Saccharopolyspora subtropica]
MRGRAWQITRAGLFLLFALVLAMLVPAQSAVEAGSVRTGSAESQTETEQRDSEKLRERLPSVALNRRSYVRREDRREPLPPELQHPDVVAGWPRIGKIPNTGSGPHHAYAKLRHSPAALQVIRH